MPGDAARLLDRLLGTMRRLEFERPAISNLLASAIEVALTGPAKRSPVHPRIAGAISP
jgi:hypothetical protein